MLFSLKTNIMGYKTIIGIAFVLFLAWLGGLILFIGSVPTQRAVAHSTLGQIDAIIVLTGGERRLREGLRLLQEKKANRLFISGVHSKIDTDDIFQALGVTKACCIDIGHHATNTRENAVETRQWMIDKGFDSLFLVTANYHMPRAHAEFRRTMPRVQMILHPVFPLNVSMGDHTLWWLGWRSSWLALSEYNKYLWTILDRSLDDS